MATVHELNLYYSEDELVYPRPVETIRLGMFTTVDKAESFMQGQLTADGAVWSREAVIELTLEEIALDLEPRFRRRRFYDAAGTFNGEIDVDQLGKAFKGREPASCRFRRGDMVEYIHGEVLQIGIVAGLPLSPIEVARFRQGWEVLEDCYLVLIGDVDHVHPHECELFTPNGCVDPKMREHLLARMRG